ncbi:MAG: NAD-binding protein, partial [Wenzhouxiangella sp.]
NTPLAVLFQRMRTPLIVLIGAYAVAVAGFTVIPGVDESGEPWTMNFLHALYVVSYTGSTIGFGEIPAEFSDAQRMWTIVCIYMTVFAWLYAIGSLVGLARDDAFRKILQLRQLRRGIRNFDEPFYLVCGYGDSGRILVDDLIRRGRRVVVVDRSQDAIQSLDMHEYNVHVPGFQLDAAIPDHLLQAGLQNRWCAGLVAVTDSDETNLKIAIAGRLLNRNLTVTACANTAETARNMASFRTGHVVRAADEFARRVTLAITRPDAYRLIERLTEAGAPQEWEPDAGLEGAWIVCGDNPYGRGVWQRLVAEGIEVRVIDENAEEKDLPDHSVTGRSSQTATLEKADVANATGLVATHESDAENLSTIMTARMLNPDLLVISRENHAHNRQLFAESGTHLAASISGMIASAIRPILEAPLATEFMEQILRQGASHHRECLDRIERLVGDRRLEFWSSRISERRTPALAGAIEAGHEITVDMLGRDPRNREQPLDAVVLMVAREDTTLLLPGQDEPLEMGDRVLFCGTPQAAELIWAIAFDADVVHYLRTGQPRLVRRPWWRRALPENA